MATLLFACPTAILPLSLLTEPQLHSGTVCQTPRYETQLVQGKDSNPQ